MTQQEMAASMAKNLVAAFNSGKQRNGYAGPIIITTSMLKAMDSLAQFREDVLNEVTKQLPDVRVWLGPTSTRIGEYLFDCITVRFDK